MSDPGLPLVSIVVLNYNGKKLLERFLPSVINLSYKNKEIIIVENGSGDGSAEFIKEKFPEVRLILNTKNFGTAEGSNIGARQAGGELIFFLSNDMELEPGMLSLMVRRILSDEKIGICTCKMKRITEAGEKLNIIDSLGGELDILGFPYARGIHERDCGQWDNPCDVFFSFGGAMLVRKKLFEQARGYDAATFTLGDDIDLCWRTHLLGYRVVVEPQAALYHQASATLGTIYGRSHKRFLSEKNTFRALLKNYSVFTLLFILPFYFCSLSLECIFFLFLGKLAMGLVYARTVKQTIQGLPDILAKRSYVQRSRKVSDWAILKILKKKSYKLEILFDFIKNKGKGPNWDHYFG